MIPVIAVKYDHGIDMQQLFAQLAVQFEAGEQWWLTAEEEALLDEHNRLHRTMKEDKKAIPTYAVLAQQHLDHAKTYQRSYDSTEMIMRRHVLPRWGKQRLDEITPHEIGKWLAEKAAEGLKPATVEKIRVVFSRSFSLGQQWSIPGCLSNPVTGVPRRRFSNARERYLTAEEAGRLFKALDGSLNPQLKHIVALLLLTGARVSELLRAEWRHVDLERRAWLIPTSKTGKPRHVPLSQAAIDIIDQLPRFDSCPYVVPNPETKLPSNAGIDLFAVGKVLGHADYKSTMRYSHCERNASRGRRSGCCEAKRPVGVLTNLTARASLMEARVIFRPFFS